MNGSERCVNDRCFDRRVGFFFNESISNAVYKRTPYSSHGLADTPNASDSIYRNGGSRSMLKLKRAVSGSGYVGAITMGVSAT